MLPVTKFHTGTARLEIQYARSTQKWMEGTDKEQIIEVIINNVGSEFVLRNHNVRVNVESPGLETVTQGIIKRLGPGDQAIVEIGIRNRKGVKAGDSGLATVLINGQHVSSLKYTFTATYGISQYEATYDPSTVTNRQTGTTMPSMVFSFTGEYTVVPGYGGTWAVKNTMLNGMLLRSLIVDKILMKCSGTGRR